MAFPTSPTNGQQANINGITYTYSSAATAWTVSTSVSNTFVSINVSDNVNSGNVLATGVISATGNVSGSNLVVTGNIVDTGALTIVTGSNGNITLSPNGTGIVAATGAISTTGNISANNATFTSNQTLSYGTANGVIYLNSNKVATSGTALVFDGTNLGVGVTPTSIQTGYKAIQIGATVGGGIVSAGTDTYFTNNAYVTGGIWYSGSTGYASYYNQSAGAHAWAISTTAGAAGAKTMSTQLTLDASGNLTLGAAVAATNRALYINGVVNKAQRIEFQESSVSKWLIGNGAASENGNFEIYDNTNGKNYVFTRTGVFALPGASASANGTGITFPATQSASTDANTLDDYEEGSWTPSLTGTSGGTYTMGGINSGRYVKIGKVVWVTATLQWTAAPSPYAGNLAVSGLPFTCTGTRAAGSLGAASNGLTFTAGYGEWNIVIDPAVTYFYIIQGSTTGAGYTHNPTVASSGICYAISLVYETST